MEENQVVEQPASESTLEDRIADKLFGGIDQEEPAEEQPESEAADQSEETQETQEVTETEEVEEVDFNGKQYKLPKPVKDALMLQSDYTRKTQELAEQRRMMESERQLQQQESQFRQSISNEVQQMYQLDYQLSQYKNLDWSSMDLETMTRTRMAYDQLKEAKSEIEKQVGAKRQQFEEGRRKVLSEFTQKANEYLSKHIPQWGNAEVTKEIAEYGLKEGFSDAELQSVIDPRIIKTLWKARQWDKLQSQKGSTKAPQKPAPTVKPSASNKSQAINDDMAYRKALRSAKSSSEKQRIIQARLEKKWA